MNKSKIFTFLTIFLTLALVSCELPSNVTNYPCPNCGTAYTTSTEKDNCSKKPGCPKYDEVFGYVAISTISDLDAMRTAICNGSTITTTTGKQVNAATAFYMLMNDIDLTDEPWTPLTADQHDFNGTFNGQGHKIIGLSDRFFHAAAANALVVNLILEDVNIINYEWGTLCPIALDYNGAIIGMQVTGSLNGYYKQYAFTTHGSVTGGLYDLHSNVTSAAGEDAVLKGVAKVTDTNVDELNNEIRAYNADKESSNIKYCNWHFEVDSATSKLKMLPGAPTSIDKTPASKDSDVPTMVDVPGKNWKICDTELTYDVWKGVYDWAIQNGYTFANEGSAAPGGTDTSRLPVVEVSWRDAKVWCNAASEKEGLTPVYTYNGNVIRTSEDDNTSAGSGKAELATRNDEANGYKLPTLEEWRYAAQGGEDYIYSGSNDYTEVAVYSGQQTYGKTKQPNAYNIYDMSGNLWEFVDKYSDGKIYSSGGGTGSLDYWYAVHSGGSWWEMVSEGGDNTPYNYEVYSGFRVIKNK